MASTGTGNLTSALAAAREEARKRLWDAPDRAVLPGGVAARVLADRLADRGHRGSH